MKLLATAVLSAAFMLAVPAATCTAASMPAVITTVDAKPTQKAKPAKKHQKHTGKHSGKHRKTTTPGN